MKHTSKLQQLSRADTLVKGDFLLEAYAAFAKSKVFGDLPTWTTTHWMMLLDRGSFWLATGTVGRRWQAYLLRQDSGWASKSGAVAPEGCSSTSSPSRSRGVQDEEPCGVRGTPFRRQASPGSKRKTGHVWSYGSFGHWWVQPESRWLYHHAGEERSPDLRQTAPTPVADSRCVVPVANR